MSMALRLWTGLSSAAAPALRLLLRRRARRGKEIAHRLAERRGIEAAPRPTGTLIWLHAASVGEAVSILPVLSALRDTAPETHVLLTTGTVTSARLLSERLPALGLHNHVRHRFAPLDVLHWVTRFLDHWKPDVAGFVESELWPNFLRGCRHRGIPLVLLNARLSTRSFAHWRRLRGMVMPMFDAITELQAQSQVDAHRFRALGVGQVSVPGNLKFSAPALPVDTTELARLRLALGARPAWVAASTHPGEEAAIFAAHAALAAHHPGLLTILAPRHPERGAAIAAAGRAAGLTVSRRALGEMPPASGLWIADTLGELGLLYRLAPIAFVGRSLRTPGGGQNPLEPARLGCAVAVGPYMGNFPDVVTVLMAAGALTQVADGTALATWVDAMLQNPAQRVAMGHAGEAACARHADLPNAVAATLLRLARQPRMETA